MPTVVYNAFGLNICSEFEFSGFLTGKGIPDVYVRLGRVPEQLDEADATGVFYQAKRGMLLLNVERVARFLISSGNEILVDVVPGAEWDMVLLLLFGSAFGALLHQRKLLVVHASAIATTRGAVLFTGASGYGKSTLAAAFHRRGFPVLADDVCAIETGDFPIVLPAYPYLMLWADASNRLAISKFHLQRIRSSLEKYVLPLGEGSAVEPIPLHAIYVLEPSNSDVFSLVPIRGIQKMKALSLTAYRPDFVEAMRLDTQYVKRLGEIASKAKVALVNRPRSGFRVDELVDRLVADFST